VTNRLFTICPPLLLVTPTSLFALPPAGGLRHAVLLNAVLITCVRPTTLQTNTPFSNFSTS